MCRSIGKYETAIISCVVIYSSANKTSLHVMFHLYVRLITISCSVTNVATQTIVYSSPFSCTNITENISFYCSFIKHLFQNNAILFITGIFNHVSNPPRTETCMGLNGPKPPSAKNSGDHLVHTILLVRLSLGIIRKWFFRPHWDSPKGGLLQKGC